MSATQHKHLIDAIKAGDIIKTKELIKTKSNIHYDNEIALRWACELGHTEIVKLLIEQRSCDLNVYVGNPIVLAIMYGHIEIVKLLIEAGAGFDYPRTIITACRHKQVEIIGVLLDAGLKVSDDTIKYLDGCDEDIINMLRRSQLKNIKSVKR
jgi:ankyrin repeat protein